MTEDDSFEPERPDPDKLKRMRENAVNRSLTNTGSAQKEVRAQILQTQQLAYDVHELNQNITELNQNLETYSKWSRLLTLTLIVIGLLSLAVASLRLYLLL